MAGIRQIFELHNEYNLEVSLCTEDLMASYLKITISLFKTLILLFFPQLINIANIEWLSVFLNRFF